MTTSNDCLATKTVCARLTPAIPSAIATIAVHGPQAAQLVGELVKFANDWKEPFPLGRIRYGLWNASSVEGASEQVVVCRTAEQLLEIHCHGGNAVCQMIINDLASHRCEPVSASEFPHSHHSEFECEAAMDLQRANSDRVAAILLDQLNGALGDAVSRIDDRFRQLGPAAVRDEVETLLSWSELGKHLTNPWQVVLAGPPNTGKSSLTNTIAGTERSIVHAEPGTTRDWVEVITAIDGWPVAISDTAGIRDSNDEIEAEGIRRAKQRVAVADLVVFVVDATVGWTDTHETLRTSAAGKRTLVVWNKVDLLQGDLSRVPSDAIRATAFDSKDNRPDIEPLLTAISKSLVPTIPDPQAAIPFRERHLKLLQQFLEPAVH